MTIDELIEKATAGSEGRWCFGDDLTRYQMAKKFPTLAVFDIDDARAVAEAAYRKGCEDTARDVSDAEIVAQMIRRGHIKISYDGLADGD